MTKPAQLVPHPLESPSNADQVPPLMHRLRASSSYRVLEQRMVFDGAAADTAVDVAAASAPSVTAETDSAADQASSCEPTANDGGGSHASGAGDLVAALASAAAAPSHASTTVVFIDSRVSDPGVIASAAPHGAEIVMLDGRSDGLEQIATYLSGRSDVDAIHIVSHGQQGELMLGNAIVTAATIGAGHADELAIIKSVLTENADIALYGCNVAKGAEGLAFIEALSIATGADIASSTDDTGAAALGGDWDLETRTGLIEAGLIDAREWNGQLAPLAISVSSAPIVTGTGAVGTTAVWTNAGFIGSTAIDLRATVTSLTTLGGLPFFGTLGDDAYVQLTQQGSLTVRWEIFAAGTNQTISAFGTPEFHIADIDGVGGVAHTRETVVPSLNHLSSYTLSTPTNLQVAVSSSGVDVSGTQDQNGETTSLVGFVWNNVSAWDVTYSLHLNQAGVQARFLHDGDGDFTFVAPNTVSLLSLDLDGNNSAASGSSYQATYTENGTPIRIADFNDVLIAQHSALGTTLGSATIVLTNAKAGDVLSSGTLPAGISASIDSSVSGKITVTLTGTATVADYQDALQAITFSSTSENPNTADRQIEVTVTNATFGTASNTALSTIHVVPVDDAPSGTDATIATAEDTAHTFTAADFGFSDPAEGHSFQSVTIQPLAGSGTLTFNGVPVTASTTISAAQIGLLVYTPVADANGAGLASLSFQVTDNGGTANGGQNTDPSPNTITFNVSPVNDAPAGTPANQTSADGNTISFDAGAAFTDVDGDDIDYTISGLTSGLTYNAETGVITGTLGPNASQGGAGGVYTITVDATDGTATATKTFTFTVTNPAPVAVNDSGTTNENAVQLIGNVKTNDHDGGLDSDTLTVTAGLNASGGALTIGTEVTLPSGAKLTLNANGTYTYKPNGAFESLDLDENTTDTFTYTISDGQGGTSTATVTIIIDGRNDAPQVGVLANISAQDGDTVSLNLGALFTDPDIEPLTFTISGLPAGLTYNPATGLVTGSIDNSASQNGLFAAPGGGTIYLIQVAASDGDSEITRSFQYKVTNPAPAPVDDANAAGEDGPAVTGNILSNDHDGVNDGDPLTLVSALNSAGQPIVFGSSVTLPSGALLILNADGTYSYDPNGSFEGLDTGETATDTFSYTISDGQGGTATATVTITITGANDAPVATDNTGSVTEDGPLTDSGNVITDDDGAGVDSDPDNEPLLVTNVNGTPVNGATTVPGLYGTLVINATGGYTYTLDNSNPTVQALGANETLTENFGYTIADGAASSVSNGSLEGTAPPVDRNTHNATLPPNWTLYQSPDVFNSATNFNGYTWAPTPDGGDFLHAIGVGGYQEGFQQVITGLVPGQQYTINFSQSLSANGYGAAGNGHWQVSFGSQTQSAPSMTTPALGSAAGWQAQSLTFTATSTSQNLLFFAVGDGGGNRVDLGIDGISIAAAGGGPLTSSANLAITIHGTNDVPVATNDAGTLGEDDSGVTGNVISGPGTDSDVDGDPLTVTTASQGAAPITIGTPFTTAGGGVLTLNAGGSYTFNPGTAYNGLDAGETATESITYTISDGNGGTATAQLVITINGANDAPVVTDPANPGTPENPIPAGDPLNIIPDVATSDGAPLTPIDVGNYVADPDGEPLTFTLDSASTPTWLSIDPATGQITGTPPANASQGSNTGNPGEYLITITAKDPDGALVTTTVTLTIVNLPPVAINDAVTASEDGPAATGNVLTDPATGDHDTAPDSDALTVTTASQGGNAITIGTPFTTAGGGVLTLNAGGGYTFEPGTAYNGLDAGETATETITYTVSDGNGGTATAQLVITVNGANDAPVVIDPANPGTASNPIPAADPLNIIPDVATSDGAALSPINVASYIVDPDGEPLTFTLDPAVPAWVVIDPVTGVISGTPPADASQGSNTGNPGEYLITITATDPGGALVTTTVTLTIVNLPPVAADDTASSSEDGPAAVGNVLGNDHDTGPDSDPLTLVLANQGGTPITIGQPFTLAGGGVLTLNADGGYTFDPGTAYDELDAGATATEAITYTVSDGHGGTAQATLTIAINGANDAPLVIDPLTGLPPADPNAIVPAQTASDGGAITPLDVTGFFKDPDTHDTLALSVDPAKLPAGITFDPMTGTFSGTPAADASQAGTPGQLAGTYVIPVTATDSHGATVTTLVVFHIANPAPVAAHDGATASEDGPAITGNALSNDHDGGGDADTLTVAAINGDPNLVDQAVAGSTGGTFILNTDGSWTFDPGRDFDNLPAGQSRDTTITYRVSDGNGGTAEATITITVNGANDAPVALGPIPPQAVTDGQPIAPIDAGTAFGNPEGLPLTFTAGSLPKGLAIDPATGLISGTVAPDASANGPYVVTVTATGPNGETSTVALQINVVNPAPIAVDDKATTPAGAPVTLAPLANDRDPDGDAVHVTAITPPANGSATLNPDGTIAYTPNPGFTGTETITYTVSDGQGGTATASITIVVGTPPADAPVLSGMPGNVSGIDGAPITPIDVGPLVSDPNGGPLAFTATGLPPGLAIDPVTGVITGTLEPDASVDGPYHVTVTAADPDGNQVTTTFVLAVANPAPAAADDHAATPAGTPVTLAPLANDREPDADTLSISHVSDPAHGTVTVNPNGTLTYTPDAGFNGTDTLTYTVSDGQGGTSIASITVSVGTPLAGAPMSSSPIVSTFGADGSPVAPIDVGAHISDANGQPLAFTATGLPDGLVIDRATGIITGTLESGASAHGPYPVAVTAVDPDGNQVTLMLVITPLNPAPVAANDTAHASSDQPVVVNVLANDRDPDGDRLAVTAASDPAHGSVTVNPDGTITFTPDAGFAGTDTFTYTVSDGNGGTTTAMVTVNVGATGGLAARPGAGPISGDDGATIVPFSVTAAFGDADQPSQLVLSVDPSALPPGITFDAATGTFSGTPAANASQGSTPGEPAGTYVVPVTAKDANGATAITYVVFSFVNLPPVAATDHSTGDEDAPRGGNVLTGTISAGGGTGAADHDTAPDSDPLAVINVNGVAVTAGTPATIALPHGALTIDSTGAWTFAPNAAANALPLGAHVTDTVTYTISDGNGGASTATLSIALTGTNDTPSVIDPANPGTPPADPLNVIPDVAVKDGVHVTPFDAGPFFKDQDGDLLTFTAAGLPKGLKIDPVTGLITGTVDHMASQGGNTGRPGEYLVTITAKDPSGATIVTTVTYKVANLGPVANDDHAGTIENRPIKIKVLGNDGDTDGDRVKVVMASAGNGRVAVNANGTLSYMPRPGFAGTDTITYVVSDGNGGFATAHVRVAVRPAGFIAPDAPRGFGAVRETAPPKSLTVEPALLDAVDGIQSNGSLSGRLGEHDIIIDATNGIESLGGVLGGDDDGFAGLASPITAGQAWRIESALRAQGYLGSSETWDARGFTGFSLRLGLAEPIAGGGAESSVLVESLVRGRTLAVQISSSVTDPARPVVEYRVMQANGQPLPGWLERAGPALLIGERPADVDAVTLRITVLYADGSFETKEVRIETMSGEVTPIAQKRSEGLDLPFGEQFAVIEDLSAEGIQELARMLGG